MSYSKADSIRRDRAIRTAGELDIFNLAVLHDPCAYCGVRVTGTDIPFHYDHIQPISRGGTYGWDNITIACRSCNVAKGSRTLLGHLLCTSYGPEIRQARRAHSIGRAG